MMQKVIRFLKKESVLVIAWVAAVISAFFVPPNAGYLGYIDFRTLGILWSLMVIMEGLKRIGLFHKIGSVLLKRTRAVWQLAVVLILLCFFFSMLITNDVALLTFVPFTIYILARIRKRQLLIPVIVLQTLAANLGSMLTPIGNPQNLYLFSLSGMSIGSFLGLMAPYTAITLLLLMVSVLFLKEKGTAIQGDLEEEEKKEERGSAVRIWVYGVLFLLALLVVLRLIPYWILCLVVLVAVFLLDKKVLISIDYALLFTFTGFFIFTGNLGSIPSISRFLTEMITGREVLTGVIASQFISNVPAALLLSGFTRQYHELILGVNFGGLGTMIASMASLISYKIFAQAYSDKKGRYFLTFTLLNLLYLGILLGSWLILRSFT